nr:type 2 isopentenyl-diphosphate Delta-isomerase [Acholeplasma laidlawii]
MSKNRKDDHINIAKSFKKKPNMFDKIILEGTDLPDLSIDDIDLSTEFLGMKVPYPFYINAMTGGSEKAHKINKFLSMIAAHFNLPMVTGSQSIMFKDPSSIESFKVIRNNHKGIIVGNINLNMTLEQAQVAVSIIEANALSIHLNVIQELVMNEGDRDFRLWSNHIESVVKHLNKPVIVKQVGLGLSLKTIQKLKTLGIKYIDVSGSGGTSFIDIESTRSAKDYSYLNDFSIDTAQTLINLKNEKDLEIYASGGIRHPLDVIKSLILGAKACGLSKWFLDLTDLEYDDAVKKVEEFIEDLKKIMLILGVSNLNHLKEVTYRIV